MGIRKILSSVVSRVAKESKSALGYKQIRDNHNHLKGMIADIKNSVKPKTGRIETFEQAQRRLGTTKQEIAKIANNYALITWLSLVVSIVCLIGLAYLLHVGGNKTSTLVYAVLAIYGLASAFRYSFWCFQIKARKLCSVSAFVGSREFIPTLNFALFASELSNAVKNNSLIKNKNNKGE